MAALWLLLFTLLSHASSSLSEKCHAQDKRALLQIKEELNNPTLLSSWQPDRDCCDVNWYGVNCVEHNRVTSLSIWNDSGVVASQFPPSIGNLPYLDYLFVYDLPNLTGPIPESISRLTKLKYLTISSTRVSGPIPDSISKLTSLVTLDLSFNNLSGTLPPSIYQLPYIEGVLFNNNELTGPIPESYGLFNNTNTPSLVLSQNQLSGRLPMSLARVNWSLIILSHNRFEGDASMLFGFTKGTVEIDLSWNSFAFDFGKVELDNTIQILDVSHNKIYGNLPPGIEKISELNVSYNRLCGEIPKGEHSYDLYSFIHNKCLCGSPLPKCK